MFIKFCLDNGIQMFFEKDLLTVLHFLLPFKFDLGAMSTEHLLTKVILSLPFLWIGLAMSVRRAVNAKLPPHLGLLFVLPFINVLLMIVLSLIPDRNKDWGLIKEGLNEHKVPKSLKTGLLATAIASLFSMLSILVSVYVLKDYSSSLFMATPVLAGFFVGFTLNRKEDRSGKETFAHVQLAVLMVGGAMLLWALEGFICIAMAAPIVIAMATIGAILGRAIARLSPGHVSSVLVLVLMVPFFGAAESTLKKESIYEVETSVVIDAPPEEIWHHLLNFGDLEPPDDWYFKLGISHPLRARIEGHGVGAVRYCEFTTGPFVEPITIWDEPNRLAFDVRSHPAPMKELSFHDDVNPPHLDGFFESQRGEFRLVKLGPNKTRLEGSTWYTMDMFPNLYWRTIAESLLHRIHTRVLTHIKDASLTSTL